MARKFPVLIGILISSLITGLLLAYITQGTTVESKPFVTMATVQGAFVGIVFSIFVLASQVSAAQFTPLTLEQLSRSRGFAVLLVFYVISILTNIYFIQAHSLPVSVPLPPEWNTALGLGASLTTASLLSLLIARQLLAELTTPEHLLERTADSVSLEDFTVSSQNYETNPTPPTRTSLFTIERILIAAHNDKDEYAVQQSIYQLWKTTDRLLTPSGLLGTKYCKPEPADYTEGIDIGKIVEYWTTAVKYGEKGPLSRIKLTAKAHRQILIRLLKINEVPRSIDQFESLYDLTTSSFEYNYAQSVLEEYEILASEVAGHESTSPLTEVIRHHALFVRNQSDALETEQEKDSIESINALLIMITCNYVMILEKIWDSQLASSTVRKRTDSVMAQLDSSLEDIFNTLSKKSNPGPRKQALLTDLQKRVVDAGSSIDRDTTQTIDRYIAILVELSLALDREPSVVANSLKKSLDSHESESESLVSRMEEWTVDENYQTELRSISSNEDSISEFVENIKTELKMED